MSGQENQPHMNNKMAPLEVRMVPSDYGYSHRQAWWDLLAERQRYDLVIHAITLINNSAKVQSVESITVEGTEHERLLQSVVFDGEEIRRQAKPILARDQLGLRRLVDLILWTDQVVPSEMILSSSTDLEPGRVLVLPNVYMQYHRRPDSVKVRVQIQADGVREVVESSLRVVEYKNQVRVNLPLQGTWLMKGTPNIGILDHHRFGVSNEFGVDFLRLDSRGNLYTNDGKQARDYYAFGKKVLAAAEGKVAKINAAEVQDYFRFNPRAGETKEQFQERQLKEVQRALQGDIAGWAAGNYILIEHARDEYSAYLHLRENSVRVKEGDFVQRGQHIADVGNTGDSFGVHLHFQLIDKPDLIHGRSLPFEFENVETSLSEPGWFVHTRR